MQLLVSVFGVHTLVAHLEGCDKVEYLREIISYHTGIPSQIIRLLSSSKQLTDDRILSDYLEIGDKSTVSVLLSCVGGMKGPKYQKKANNNVFQRISGLPLANPSTTNYVEAEKHAGGETADSKNELQSDGQTSHDMARVEAGLASINMSSSFIAPPRSNESLYDILKDEFKDFEGLNSLVEGKLKWRHVENIETNVNGDRAQFESKLDYALSLATKDALFSNLAAIFLTNKAFASQVPPNVPPLSASDQVVMNEISTVLKDPNQLIQYRDHFKTAEDCFTSMGWQINVEACPADVRDLRIDAIAYIVAGILLRDGLRAHLIQEKVFCDAPEEEREAAVRLAKDIFKRRNNDASIADRPDDRVFDTFLAVSASPGMGKSMLIKLLCQSVRDSGFIRCLKAKVKTAVGQFPGGKGISRTIGSGFDNFVEACRLNKIYVCAITFNSASPPSSRSPDLEDNLTLRALYDVANLPPGIDFNMFQDIIPKESRRNYLKNALKVVKAVTDSRYVILATDELLKLPSVKREPDIQLSMLSDCFNQPHFQFLFSSLLISPLDTYSFRSGYRSVVIPLGTLTQIKAELLNKFARKIARKYTSVDNARFLARSVLAASQYHGRTLALLWNEIVTDSTAHTLKDFANLVKLSPLMCIEYDQIRNALLGIAIRKCTDASDASAFAKWQSLVFSGTLISHSVGEESVIPVISLFCLFSDWNMQYEALDCFRDIARNGPVQTGAEFEHFVHLWEIGRRQLIRGDEHMTLSKLYRLRGVETYRRHESFDTWDIEIEMWRTMGKKYLLICKKNRRLIYHVREEPLNVTSVDYNVDEWKSLADRRNFCYLTVGSQAGFDILSYFKIKETDKQVVLATEVKSNLATTEGKGQEIKPEDVIDKIKKTSKVLSYEIDQGNEVCFLILCSCDTQETIRKLYDHNIPRTKDDDGWLQKLREYSADSHFMHVFQRSVVFPRAAVNSLVGPSLESLLYDPSNI